MLGRWRHAPASATRRQVPKGGRRRGRDATGGSPDDLLSPAEAAAIAGVTTGAIRTFRLYGKLPYVTIGTHHAYRRGELLRFLTERGDRLDAFEASGRALPPGVRKKSRR